MNARLNADKCREAAARLTQPGAFIISHVLMASPAAVCAVKWLASAGGLFPPQASCVAASASRRNTQAFHNIFLCVLHTHHRPPPNIEIQRG